MFSENKTQGQEQYQFVGSGTVVPEIVDPNAVKSRHKYVVKFHNDTLRTVRGTTLGLQYVAKGLSVFDLSTHNPQLVFEDLGAHPGSIVQDYSETLGYHSIRTGDAILTSSFQGIRLKLQNEVLVAQPSPNIGWQVGSAPISVIVVPDVVGDESIYPFPWDHEIVFSDNPQAFVSELQVDRTTRIYDEHGVRIREGLLGQQSFPFILRNTTFGATYKDEPIGIEMVVQDLNLDEQFNLLDDRVLVGYMDERERWAETVLVIDMTPAASEAELPQPGDIYRIAFERPFWADDSLVFIVDPEGTFIDDQPTTPTKMQLSANYPNPFNPKTKITYAISHRVPVKLQVYNILGQHVVTLTDKVHEPGRYTLQFDGNHLPSGLYFYTLQAGDFFARRKMLLVR